MLKTVVLVLCVLVAASDQCSTPPKTRVTHRRVPNIVDNTEVVPAKDINITDVPFLVHVEHMNDQICAGSILSQKFILTAADCTAWYDLRDLRIRYGTSRLNKGGKTIQVSKVFIHPGFDYNNLNYDACVLQLAKHIQFSNIAKSIALASYEPLAGEKAYVPGWDTLMDGGYLSNKLKSVEVRVIDYDECYKKYTYSFFRSVLCARASLGCTNATPLNPMCEGDCHGDRGGPLVIKNVQYGIVSSGLSCKPGVVLRVYSNVASLREFIDESTDKSIKWV